LDQKLRDGSSDGPLWRQCESHVLAAFPEVRLIILSLISL
jgi:hypothetical protein